MRLRKKYIPVAEAQAGMLLGAPADGVRGGSIAFSLPSGHRLTEENLRQLSAHAVEFIFILQPDSRTEENVATDAAVAARRVMEVFSGADLSDPNMMAFFDQVISFRSA